LCDYNVEGLFDAKRIIGPKSFEETAAYIKRAKKKWIDTLMINIFYDDKRFTVISKRL
jgi:hypothetical protein